MEKLIAELLSADPEFAEWVAMQESAFAHAAATGYISLKNSPEKAERYRLLVQDAGKKGPALGQVIAAHLAPVLQCGKNGFYEKFLFVIEVISTKGTYALNPPLESLTLLLNAGDTDSGRRYLDLLKDAFLQEMSYNQSQRLSYLLPKAALSYAPKKRVWQIDALRRVVKTDFRLAEPFSEGMDKGLSLLSEHALNQFIKLGLEKLSHKRELGIKFLSLESQAGADAFKNLQVTASLSQIQARLNRYLQAAGILLSVKPMSQILQCNDSAMVCSDGKFIYLPEEIGIFFSKEENIALYKCLTKLEAAYYEFNTFGFDLEKIIPSHPVSDLESFFDLFPLKQLAEDLFTVFEHGRIRILLERHYPGIVRQAFPLLKREPVSGSLDFLYQQIALSNQAGNSRITSLFEEKMKKNQAVEACAELVSDIYSDLELLFPEYQALKTPFGRKPRPDLFFSTYRHQADMAKRIKLKLEEHGLKAYTSDIQAHLIRNNGQLSPEDIRKLTGCADILLPDLAEITEKPMLEMLQDNTSPYPVFWYKEWSQDVGDYLHNHVRVSDRFINGVQSDFYPLTLIRYKGLVRKMRHAFELLKPEGLVILRRWIEGDAFDYQALPDFVIDRKAGLTPSERLYIKRIKQHRDVAVLLLVDLSRSTANKVMDSDLSVLGVEKEAIVLFCEALKVVGDAFAIAGFSGTGRLGVDYFRIKDFDEALNDTVKERINAMTPQRSTRMGAAIRHATAQLENMPAGVRLMIILGDGFPNDTDYKREYAIEDTRKAISEAHSKAIHVRAITVNLATDAQLDDLYGSLHHNVISDVRELPDKLLRIYRNLTH
jgi:hypothetical protein